MSSIAPYKYTNATTEGSKQIYYNPTIESSFWAIYKNWESVVNSLHDILAFNFLHFIVCMSIESFGSPL